MPNTRGSMAADDILMVDNGDGSLTPIVQVSGTSSPAATADGVAAASVPEEAVALWNGATMDRQRTPNVFKGGALVSASGVTNVWTPASGKRFRLLRYRIVVPAGSTVGSNAMVQLIVTDGGVGLFAGGEYVWITTTAQSGPALLVTPWIDLGNGYLSSAQNNACGLYVGTAFTAGGAYLQTAGTEE